MSQGIDVYLRNLRYLNDFESNNGRFSSSEGKSLIMME